MSLYTFFFHDACLAHLNLTTEHLPYKEIIGQVILDVTRSIISWLDDAFTSHSLEKSEYQNRADKNWRDSKCLSCI